MATRLRSDKEKKKKKDVVETLAWSFTATVRLLSRIEEALAWDNCRLKTLRAGWES